MPAVSVIIAPYNGASCIRRAVVSVLPALLSFAYEIRRRPLGVAS